MGFKDRLSHAWNALTGNDQFSYYNYGNGSYTKPDRIRLSRGNEKSIVTAIYTRIALDTSSIKIEHIKLDENKRFVAEIESKLNNCLSIEANKDQTARNFIKDIVLSMFDEGCIAIVPVDTTIDPNNTDSYDVVTLRTAKILEWYPDHIKVRIYNDKTGRQVEMMVPKRTTAIIENPFYEIVNEPNSTMQRLVRKLSLLDTTDEQNSSGKLDIIIQLPYVVRNETRKKQAEERRKAVEMQLAGSKYGIAYTDGTERITQLNRAVENNLLAQVEYLTNMVFSQLGITQEILNGTANEETMLNYYNRTIEPILSAIVDEMKRKFLTKTARTQGQSIQFYRDPFKLAPINSVAEIADKFTRNEIMTSNEIRQAIGMRPSDNPKADELVNSNMPSQDSEAEPAPESDSEANIGDSSKISVEGLQKIYNEA